MKTKSIELTAELANAILRYDPQTGELIWKVRRPYGKKAAGGSALVKSFSGSKMYYKVWVNGKLYFAHRVIWLMISGAWPEAEIDHIDGDGLNNRRDNLRSVSRTENSRNLRRSSRNTSGAMGVYWDKRNQKWHACLVVNGVNLSFGRFTDKDTAIAARKSAEVIHGFHANHGVASGEVV
jgi:hypothetical protein